jgi:hypothetical protein
VWHGRTAFGRHGAQAGRETTEVRGGPHQRGDRRIGRARTSPATECDGEGGSVNCTPLAISVLPETRQARLKGIEVREGDSASAGEGARSRLLSRIQAYHP